MKKGMLFPCAEPPTQAEYESVGIRSDRYHPSKRRMVRVEATGEFRCPKQGEWYVSGAIAEGWRAPSDLSTAFYIAALVRVTTRTIVRIVQRAKEGA